MKFQRGWYQIVNLKCMQKFRSFHLGGGSPERANLLQLLFRGMKRCKELHEMVPSVLMTRETTLRTALADVLERTLRGAKRDQSTRPTQTHSAAQQMRFGGLRVVASYCTRPGLLPSNASRGFTQHICHMPHWCYRSTYDTPALPRWTVTCRSIDRATSATVWCSAFILKTKSSTYNGLDNFYHDSSHHDHHCSQKLFKNSPKKTLKEKILVNRE